MLAAGSQRASVAGARVGGARRVMPMRTSRRTAVVAQAKKVEKVVLAYSGGLDTSVILKWLQETYDCEVVTFTADLGQVGSGPQQEMQRGSTRAGVLIRTQPCMAIDTALLHSPSLLSTARLRRQQLRSKGGVTCKSIVVCSEASAVGDQHPVQRHRRCQATAASGQIQQDQYHLLQMRMHLPGEGLRL
jgi:hypothetical protein